MERRFEMLRAGIVAVIVASTLLLASVQAGSDSIFAGAAAPYALPAHLPLAVGRSIYGALDRIAPAPYVLDMLTAAALDAGDLTAARAAAMRIPDRQMREEYLARIDAARGDAARSFAENDAADDTDNVQRGIAALAVRDPQRAYVLEQHFAQRLAVERTHPDALAEAWFTLGVLATARAYTHPAQRSHWMPVSLEHYERAIALAPFEAKYLLSAANQAAAMGRLDVAQGYYLRCLQADPTAGDALAGLGLIAMQRGDRAAALEYLRRARERHAEASLLSQLERVLR